MHTLTSHRTTSRATRTPRILRLTVAAAGAVAALGACAEQPTAATPTHAPSLHRQVGTSSVFTITSNSGDYAVGTLAWAVATAAHGDVIRFDPSLAGDTIALETTLKAANFVTIEGPADKGITLSGQNERKVFHLKWGGTLRNVTIINGYNPSGSPIISDGRLTLEHSTVANNRGIGAAIKAVEVFLINSTVSGNTGSDVASGIAYEYRFTLDNSTVAHNGPAPGIGEYSAGWEPDVILRNSIVSDNGSPLRNCKSTLGFQYQGMNIASDYSCGNTAGIVVHDPRLLGLADNGGPTMTEAFDYRSTALDAAPGCTVTVDQRYVPRVGTCDIGAYEFTDFTQVTLAIDPNATVDASNGFTTVTGTVKCSRDGDRFGVTVDLEQEQKVGKSTTIVRGTGGTGITCTTSAQRWSVSVGGPFDSGPATATASTNDPPVWVMPTSTSSAIRLARPRR